MRGLPDGIVLFLLAISTVTSIHPSRRDASSYSREITVLQGSGAQKVLDAAKKASPAVHAAVSQADAEMRSIYEDVLHDLQETFNEVAEDLKKAAGGGRGRGVEAPLKAATQLVADKLQKAKETGVLIAQDAGSQAVQLVGGLPVQQSAQLAPLFAPFFSYDNLQLMPSLSPILPAYGSRLSAAAQPIQNAANQMASAVAGYVQNTMSDVRVAVPPATLTINELEKKLIEEINELSKKTNKKLEGIVGMDTSTAVAQMSPSESSQISVIQTYPLFSLVSLATTAPSLSASLNVSSERVMAVIDGFHEQLFPYVDGQIIDPTILKIVPANEQREKSTKELLGSLKKQVSDYLDKSHPAKAVDAAKEVAGKPEAKKQLAKEVDKAAAAKAQQLPLLYTTWYNAAPVFYTQAVDLAQSTAQQLVDSSSDAANYALTLMVNMFGQYEWAALPLAKMAAKSAAAKHPAKVVDKLHVTLPAAIAQGVAEQNSTSRAALQQVMLTLIYPPTFPDWPFFG